MHWLNAALAFAITMLIMSMITSTIVETAHRLLRLREKGLSMMLDHLYDRVMANYTSGDGKTSKGAFIEMMTVNRAPAATNSKWSLHRVWNGQRLSMLGVHEFMARLGSSEFGDALKAIAGDALDETVKDVAQKFEAFGAEVSQYFERRARLTSIIVALIVAWIFYVQPRELVQTYLNKPEVTETVITMGGEVKRKFEDSKVKLDEANAKAQAAKEAAREAAEAAEKAPADAKAAAEDAASKETEAAKEAMQDEADARKEFDAAVDELGKNIAEGKAEVAKLQEAGVPIGWTADRYKATGFFADEFFGLPWPSLNEWKSETIATVFWLLIGGLLVGLGGPFWYDMVTSITNIRQLVSSVRGGEAKKDEPLQEAEGASQPKTPLEHFMVASDARAALQAKKAATSAAGG